MFCPSCHENWALEKAGWVAEHVCAEVLHRQFVFTIPERLWIYFRFDRRLLGELCRAAARAVIAVYRAASGRSDAVPGMVGANQTFGAWHTSATSKKANSYLQVQVRRGPDEWRRARACAVAHAPPP
jgi:hypothetical protein